MGILTRALDRFEKRHTIADLDKVMDMGIGGIPATSGVNVNPDTALAVTAVYACVKVLAETIGSLPINMIKRGPGDTRSRDLDHPLSALLKKRPNPWHTSMEFRELLQGHLALWGNAYAAIQTANAGRIDRLIPLHPGRTMPRWVSLVAGAMASPDIPIEPDEQILIYRHVDRKGRVHILLED